MKGLTPGRMNQKKKNDFGGDLNHRDYNFQHGFSPCEKPAHQWSSETDIRDMEEMWEENPQLYEIAAKTEKKRTHTYLKDEPELV